MNLLFLSAVPFPVGESEVLAIKTAVVPRPLPAEYPGTSLKLKVLLSTVVLCLASIMVRGRPTDSNVL